MLFQSNMCPEAIGATELIPHMVFDRMCRLRNKKPVAECMVKDFLSQHFSIFPLFVVVVVVGRR